MLRIQSESLKTFRNEPAYHAWVAWRCLMHPSDETSWIREYDTALTAFQNYERKGSDFGEVSVPEKFGAAGKPSLQVQHWQSFPSEEKLNMWLLSAIKFGTLDADDVLEIEAGKVNEKKVEDMFCLTEVKTWISKT